MTITAIEGLRADREAILGLCGALSPADWSAESGCPGWTVQDVVAHVGGLFWQVVDPSALPDISGLPTERAQDAIVECRRSMSSEEVLADYEAVSIKALDALTGLVGQDFEVPLGDLGTYPADSLASAFAFDHFLHIRSDLFAPRGPLLGDSPPADELRVAPALDWVEAALPQQNAGGIASLAHAVQIDLSGPGARSIVVGAGAGAGEPASRVQSDTSSFLRWITQRATWAQTGVTASGNEADLAVVAALHVF